MYLTAPRHHSVRTTQEKWDHEKVAFSGVGVYTHPLCTTLRAYDKILRWPDNMSGHYIFSTDILKNTWTIIVISIFIVIVINMQVYMYCIHTVYQYNMRSYT